MMRDFAVGLFRESVSRARTWSTLVLIVLGAGAATSAARAQSGGVADLDGASWIWAASGARAEPAPVCYLRKTLDVAAAPAKAMILITADNDYDLYVNGTYVGGDGGTAMTYWRSVERWDVGPLLRAGRNVVAVKGRCLGGAAGLLASIHAELPDGSTLDLPTDVTWRLQVSHERAWKEVGHDDGHWPAATVIASFGEGVWGKLSFPEPRSPGTRTRPTLVEPGPDFEYPAGVVFVTGNVQVSDPKALNIFRIGRTRAYFENDIPSPAALGRKLVSLVPARPGGTLRSLHDAGTGVLGSPSVSFDGGTIYFAMAPAKEKFFHIHRIAADGTSLSALTSGPFHDYDPQPLPGGDIVFSSTRMGGRDEYHGNVASSLFVMNADGGAIRPLTHHIVGDREPRVTADGGLVFVRSDNFLERAKVETQIHRTRLDGTGGTVVLGADRGAIGLDRERAAEHDSAWLRKYGAGSPAPLPDGRIAAITERGLVVGGDGRSRRIPVSPPPFDISPLPDGRLLCTLPDRAGLGVIDLEKGQTFLVYPFDGAHSVTHLGPRTRPPSIAPTVDAHAARGIDATGFLFCQDVTRTRQTGADVSRIRAVRVYEGRPLTVRSVGHHLVHIGVEAVELGTAPLAPDGSIHVEVPADRPLALQAVDAQGRAVINELTWIYVRPGERRGCVGCHLPRQHTPALAPGSMATRGKPIALLGQGRPHRFRGNNGANGGVLNLQMDRFREVASIDVYSSPDDADRDDTAGLAPARSSEVERLRAELRSTRAGLRISAARRLAIIRDPEAADALLGALRDHDAQVRCAAALALATCAGRNAVAGLLDALK
ncbi:MAG: hypothetical protein CMJ83_21915, partial [Planctomycetes bacterium]|nr:hypothetical protein [Planctomycetota bacterium]